MSEPITPGEDGGSASMAERTTAVTAIELLLDLVFVAAIGQPAFPWRSRMDPGASRSLRHISSLSWAK